MKRKRRKLKLKASESAKVSSSDPAKPDAYVLHVRRAMPVARAVLWTPLFPDPGRADPESDADSTYEIFVSQAALRDVQRHVWDTDSRTHWGFMLGSLFECPKSRRRYTVIESVLRGSGFFEEANQGAIFAATWAAMEKERHRVGAELLGWYHSHAHLGVVVSEADAQSHLTHFGDPCHCMLVLTPAGSDPAGGFFRSTGRGGISRRHPVPFYELLEPESLLPHAKRSLLAWSNYETRDAVIRADAEQPGPGDTPLVADGAARAEIALEPVAEVRGPEPEPVAEVEESQPEPVAELRQPEPEPQPVAEVQEPEPESVAEVEEPEPEPVAEVEEPEPVAEVRQPEPEPVAEVEEPEPAQGLEPDLVAAAARVRAEPELAEATRAGGKAASRKLEKLPRSRVETPDLVIPAEVESTLVPFARRANGGLIGMLAALGVLFVVVYLMNWTSEADGDLPETVVPVATSVNPAVERFDAHLEALNQAIIAYGERQVDFDLGRIGCEGMGLGYGEADDTFVSTSQEFVASRSLITIRQRQEYDSLVVRMDDVNKHFDESGCPRPD